MKKNSSENFKKGFDYGKYKSSSWKKKNKIRSLDRRNGKKRKAMRNEKKKWMNRSKKIELATKHLNNKRKEEGEE
jgi:hypothetical protein